MSKEKNVQYINLAPEDVEDVDALSAAITERDFDINYGEIFSRGWEVYKKNFGLLIGAYLVCSFTHALPVVGGLVYFVMYGGYLMMVMNGIRSSNSESLMRFNDMFSCFTLVVPLFCQAMLLCVIYITMVIAIIGSGYGACFYFHVPCAVGVAVACLVAIPCIYICVSISFATPIMIEFHEKQFGVFRSIGLSWKQVNRHWWPVFGFQLTLMLVAMSGMLFFIVGIFFTVPLAIVLDMVAFDRVFGLLTRDYRASNCVVCV